MEKKMAKQRKQHIKTSITYSWEFLFEITAI